MAKMQSRMRLTRAVRSDDQITLSANVTPKEAESLLRWSKSGDGFDISPNGTSCTVSGNTDFDGYDSYGTVTAEVSSTDTMTGAKDSCSISVVKDKGNLCDPGEFSTLTTNGVTLTRTIANKYVFSGSPTYGDDPSSTVSYTINRQSLDEGVYSLAKSDYTHAGSNVTSAMAQFYSPDGGNLYGSRNAALTDGSFSFNVQFTFSGGDVSGYVVPFLSKVPDSGQLIEGHDLSVDVANWNTDAGTSISFSGTDAVLSATERDSRMFLDTSIFSHTTGDVYAAFLDVYSDDVSSIRVGVISSPATVRITSTKKRYGAVYTARTDQAFSIIADSAGTIRVSNVKLVRITDTSSFNSFATLDEPRIEPLFL